MAVHSYRGYIDTKEQLTVHGRVFVSTNEVNTLKSIEKVNEFIKEYPCEPGKSKLAMGCSGLYCLNLFSLEDLEEIIIFDCAHAVKIFWEQIVEIIKKAKEHKEAQKAIIDFIDHIPDNYPNLFGIWSDNISEKDKNEISKEESQEHNTKIMGEINQKISFLSTQERYDRIRKVIVNGKFSFHLANVNFPETFKEINEKVSQASLRILYTSNIRDYKSSADSYVDVFKDLLNKNTIIVDAHISHNGIYQDARFAGFSDLKDRKSLQGLLLHCSDAKV